MHVYACTRYHTDEDPHIVHTWIYTCEQANDLDIVTTPSVLHVCV